ncbi:hypothetical protein ACKI1Q_38475 [Streptomyces galilaeus]|uniref:hypothetical protein n=1 Tax=Streptomyces galilaeus TaxID=33899 RepID=UPI0038F6BE0F
MVIVSSMDAADRDDLGGRARRIDQRSLALAAVMSVVGEGPDQVRALTVICTYDSLNKIKNGRTAYEFSVVRGASASMSAARCSLIRLGDRGSLCAAACRAGVTLSQLSVIRRT